jgi:hypothetical protein
VQTTLVSSSRTCLTPADTIFFYSNHPEKLPAPDLAQGVLWHDARTLVPAQVRIRYRCFLWHNNETDPGTDLYAGPVLLNTGTRLLSVGGANVVGQMFTNEGDGPNPPAGWPLSFGWHRRHQDGGRCVSQAMLYAGLDDATLNTIAVGAGETVSLLDWGPLSPYKM